MSIEQSTFEYSEAIETVSTVEELEQTLAKFLAPLGAEFFVAGQVRFPHGFGKPSKIFGYFDYDWYRFYDQFQLFLEDPAARFLNETSRPFTWSWVTDNLDLTNGEKFVMNEPRNFGLSEGLVVPMHGPYGALGLVTAAGKHFNPCRRETLAIQIVFTRAYHRSLVLTQLFEKQQPLRLTKRQRECLTWLQQGKSNQDVAAILGISAETVKEHIEGAKKSLGVKSRIEAILRARQANLIATYPSPLIGGSAHSGGRR